MKILNQKLFLLLTISFVGISSFAQEATNPAPAPVPAPAPESESEAQALTWNQLIQRKYNLTDAQMQTLTAAKLPEPHSARVAHLAQISGKSIEDVLKMRNEDKMGWGQIAKQLGVSESELGKAVSSLRKERNEERKREQTAKRQKEKEERLKKQEEKRKEREAKMEEKRKEREEKRKEQQEKREQKKEERKEKSQGKGRK